jgi:formylglycine-generating enzyme required for sulfatase activity
MVRKAAQFFELARSRGMRNTIALAILAALYGCAPTGSEDKPDGGVVDPTDDAGCVGSACEEPGRCPAGMVWISPSTCIDATEATVNDFLLFANSLGDSCTDPGPTCTACNGKRCFISNVDNPWHYEDGSWYIDGPVGMSLEHPARYVTFEAARTACGLAGKRLCGADEWTRACGGPTQLAYPYGNTYEQGRCNTASGIIGSPWAVGDDPSCANTATPQLVDMSGNVWEWTNDCSGGDCTLRGGSFNVDGSFFPNALSCEGTKSWDTVNETFGTDHDFGYRCCVNPL